MSWAQLALFPDELYHEPTTAERRGDTAVVMCQQCGTLTATATRVQLGPCPACGLTTWRRQPVDVGPFRKYDTGPAQ